MFQKFSNSYYLKSYWIEKNLNNNKINKSEYNKIKKQLYDNNTPIIMKLGSVHFEVEGDDNVSSNTIQLSDSIISNLQLKRLPNYHPVLLTEPNFAKQIINLKNTSIKSGINNI